MEETKEEIIKVTAFEPRWYQRDLINALEHEGKKKFVIVWPRRAGKDVASLNLMLRQAFKRVGVYYYLYPKYDQCRRAIWDSILITGEKFLDFIPKRLIAKKNNVEMKIVLVNGSIIQFNGADNADSLRGTNPVGVVFSEYSRVNHPEAYNGVIAPILAANHGWVTFISTPNGHNAFHEVYKYGMSGEDPDWYVKMLTVDETKHMTPEQLAKEKARMSEELFLQEYYCSFEVSNTGSWYAKYVHSAYAENRVGYVPHDSNHLVHTAWDLGVRAASVVIFYQVIGRKICVINHYHRNNEGLSHYVSVLRSYSSEYGYQYGQHFVPHDAANRDVKDCKSRLDVLSDLGIEPTMLGRAGFHDGIEAVRVKFKRIFIDEKSCSLLLDALENYSRYWDPMTKRFVNDEKKDWTNDHVDAFRYMCLSIDRIDTDERSPEEFDKKYKELIYGGESNLPPVFSDREY